MGGDASASGDEYNTDSFDRPEAEGQNQLIRINWKSKSTDRKTSTNTKNSSLYFSYVSIILHNHTLSAPVTSLPHDIITYRLSGPDLCSWWWGQCPLQKGTCKRCVHPESVPLSPHSPRKSSWPPLTDWAHYEPGGPAMEREGVRLSAQDQWKDMVYMDCYKIWHER